MFCQHFLYKLHSSSLFLGHKNSRQAETLCRNAYTSKHILRSTVQYILLRSLNFLQLLLEDSKAGVKNQHF